MQDESGGGWSAGKIILAIVGGCFLLTTLCCTGTYLAKKDKINEAFSFMGETYSFGVQFAEGIARFEAGFAVSLPDLNVAVPWIRNRSLSICWPPAWLTAAPSPSSMAGS